MSVKHLILATAGHVDHGKSSLVKALTGVDPDRLPEEKIRGITIDLGFARLELPAGPEGGPALDLGIVDVPGHEDFVKNMVAGVGSIDLALLVVAADDGWMPQTEEHLQILEYLGVKHGVVALTKADLCPDVAAATAAVRARLADSAFAGSPLVPTSIPSGDGLDSLRQSLRQVAAATPEPVDIGKPRLPVDRVFVLRGVGTVATGTLSGGRLTAGQEVAIQPQGRAARLRGIQVHNQNVPSSVPGCRTAVNLPELKAGIDLRRGDVITLPTLGGSSGLLDVLLERSKRLDPRKPGAGRPLKDGARVRVHLGTAEVPASVQLVGGSAALVAGEAAVARLRLESPLFAFAGDRFIVRDWPEQSTLAGGTVLDPLPAAGPMIPATGERLQALSTALGDADRWVETMVLTAHAILCDRVGVRSRYASDTVNAAIARLAEQGKVVVSDEWVMAPDWWRQVLAEASTRIKMEHRQHPERLGLPLTDLRVSLEARLPGPELFPIVVAELTREACVQCGGVIRSRAHVPALPPGLQAAGGRVLATLAARPLDPPSRKELAPDSAGQQVIRFLVQTGQVIELSEEVLLLAVEYARAVEIVRRHLRNRGSSTASELRQALGTSRRVVIPLLERLDKEGVTRRQGDRRSLR